MRNHQRDDQEGDKDWTVKKKKKRLKNLDDRSQHSFSFWDVGALIILFRSSFFIWNGVMFVLLQSCST